MIEFISSIISARPVERKVEPVEGASPNRKVEKECSHDGNSQAPRSSIMIRLNGREEEVLVPSEPRASYDGNAHIVAYNPIGRIVNKRV